MSTVSVFDMAGKETGKMELADSVFGIEPNATVLHAAVVNYLANQRQGTQSTLTRSEVSGGGKKPWRQKGTGHARQGSTRAPSGRTAVSRWVPSPVITPMSFRRRCAVWRSNPRSLRRWLPAICWCSNP